MQLDSSLGAGVMSPLLSRQAQRDGGGIYGVHGFAEFFAGKPSSQQEGVQPIQGVVNVFVDLIVSVLVYIGLR